MRKINILFILLITNQIFSQNFKVSAKLNPLISNGLHKILLTPEIRSHTKSDLSDFRIFGGSGNEIPYFIWKNNNGNATSDFIPYKVVYKNILPNNSTTIIFENPENEKISEIILKINNFKLSKIGNISGSNDQKQWFGILDKYEISDFANKNSSNFITKIEIPTSTYQFIKLEINDRKTAPINILKIGKIVNLPTDLKVESVTPISIVTTNLDSQKKTLLKVSFNRPNAINQIEFNIVKPNFYNRKAKIIAKGNRKKANKSIESYFETLAEFYLNAENKKAIEIIEIRENEFFIEIENDDNPPLSISNIKLNQYLTYVVADLNTNENYTIKVGSDILKMPDYDISYFKSNVSNSIPEAKIIDLTTVKSTIEKSNTKIYFWQEKWFLWLCIGITGIVILYFSTFLIKDLNKNNN